MLIGLLLLIQSYCIFSAVARIPVALALLAFNTYPLVIALITWWLDGERPSRRALIAMPVALAGLALALDAGGWSDRGAAGFGARWDDIGVGVLFACGASLSFSAAMHLTTRWLKGVDGRLRTLLAKARQRESRVRSTRRWSRFRPGSQPQCATFAAT